VRMGVPHLRRDRSPWSDAAPGPLRIAAEHRLVADALSVALQGEGFRTAVATPGARASSRLAGRGLLVCDLDGDASLRWVRSTLRRSDTAWVVLTSAPRGPLWGGVLESGAVEVLPMSTSLGDLADLIEAGVREDTDDEHARLVDQWVTLAAERRDQLERMRSLSPREMQVLGMLYDGRPVADIAQTLGLAPDTVRSQVSAVRRKLGVGSQLAAVAVYGLVARRLLPGGLRHVLADAVALHD
jgi:DNA-binding NarL/FixJ family response regulator